MKVRKAELISITMLLRYPDTRPFAFASYAVLRLLNRLLQYVWALTELFLPTLHVNYHILLEWEILGHGAYLLLLRFSLVVNI